MSESVPDPHLRIAVSNGQPQEQRLIRKWWHEEHGARGRLVWEYCLEDWYADAIWFPHETAAGGEQPGIAAASRFPLEGQRVVLCEAKARLTPELIGQAMVYRKLAESAGAQVDRVVIFSVRAPARLRGIAEDLGLEVVVG